MRTLFFSFAKSFWIHTWHVDHSAVAILQQVPGFTVNAAGGDAIRGEEFRVYGCRLAISPRRREVLKLKERTACFSSVYHHTGLQWITQCKPSAVEEQKEDGKHTKPNITSPIKYMYVFKWKMCTETILAQKVHSEQHDCPCIAAGRHHAEHYWCRSSPW